MTEERLKEMEEFYSKSSLKDIHGKSQITLDIEELIAEVRRLLKVEERACKTIKQMQAKLYRLGDV